MHRFIRTSLLAALGRPLGFSDRTATLARALADLRRAVRDGRFDDALRLVDRAWRHEPAAAELIASLYARALCLADRDHEAALALLRRSLDWTPDPDDAALNALTLLRLGRPDDARAALDAALTRYCVTPDGLLARIAGALVREAALAAAGWIGLGPHHELVGECALASAADLAIRCDGAAAGGAGAAPNSGSHAVIHRVLTEVTAGARIEAFAAGAPLVGSGLRRPDDYRLDGRITQDGRHFSAWARIAWAPAVAPSFRISHERGGSAELPAQGADPRHRWQLRLDRRAPPLRGQRIAVEVRLPDGAWQALPDSPLLREPAVRLGVRMPRLAAWGAPVATRTHAPPPIRRRARAQARRVDIIVPVYGNREETLACLESVLATTEGRGRDGPRVVVIDDASPDPRLGADLEALAGGGRIELWRNDANLGFVRAVNRGLALHPERDAVLLNADTRVFGDWLARLRAAAYAETHVGSATPFSNNGSIASYPDSLGREPRQRPGNDFGLAIDVAAAAQLQALAARVHAGVSAEIPVGVGFCLYLRRDCLADVGELDAAVFGKGYGEETDWCLRAARRGWTHRLAADVYVYHAGGTSFGARRAALLARSAPLLNLRHPGFDRYVADFSRVDPLAPLRRRLDAARLLATGGRRVLVVGVAMLGGVQRYVHERCRALRAEGVVPIVLRAAAPSDLRRCELVSDELDLPNLRYLIPGELGELRALLEALRIEAIEFQHFLHLDARVVELLRGLDVPYDVVVHDYAWVCPRITLVDATDRYCGEPPVAVCERCIRRNGSELGERTSVTGLRTRSARWLGGARWVSAPSADTAARFARYFPDLSIIVRPHTAPVMAPEVLPAGRPRPAGAPVRVALLGAIGAHKGYRVLLACARDARARRLPLEFVIIGYSEHDAPLLATGKVFITGAYGEVEAPDLLRREAADLVWLPSVWPETWSYVLDHALCSGLPIAAFDLGAIAERLHGTGRGELMSLALTPRAINAKLLACAKRHRETASRSRTTETPRSRPTGRANRELLLSKSSPLPAKSTTKPAEAPAPATATAPSPAVLAASVQVLPMPAGFYMFSVTAATPSSGNGEALSLPAMLVSVGPGVPATQVEFVAGQTDRGNWLFAADDLLVAKVKGAGVTLILTSVRAADGRALSIKVERLGAATTTLADAIANPPAAVAAPKPAMPAPAPAPAANSGGANLGAANGPLAVAGAGAGRAPARSGAPRADGRVPLQISAHISTRGDVSFTDPEWVGRLVPGQWIESFALEPLERLGARDLEYKGLTASGFETPWISDGKICGTKAMATPLVGFALRLRPSAATAGYDCEYSGYFKSGLIVGPLRNGAPCRSTVAADPLEGMRVQIVARAAKPGADGAEAASARDRKSAAGRGGDKRPKVSKVSKPGKQRPAARST